MTSLRGLSSATHSWAAFVPRINFASPSDNLLRSQISPRNFIHSIIRSFAKSSLKMGKFWKRRAKVPLKFRIPSKSLEWSKIGNFEELLRSKRDREFYNRTLHFHFVNRSDSTEPRSYIWGILTLYRKTKYKLNWNYFLTANEIKINDQELNF